MWDTCATITEMVIPTKYVLHTELMSFPGTTYRSVKGLATRIEIVERIQKS